MPESPQSVDGYLASLPDGRREVVTRVHETIAEAVPEHRYASGREGDWFPIGLTNNKSYVSLYFCAAEGDGYLAEKNQDRLGNVSVGKSCVRFKRVEDVNLDVVAELARRAAALTESGQFAM